MLISVKIYATITITERYGIVWIGTYFLPFHYSIRTSSVPLVLFWKHTKTYLYVLFDTMNITKEYVALCFDYSTKPSALFLLQAERYRIFWLGISEIQMLFITLTVR